MNSYMRKHSFLSYSIFCVLQLPNARMCFFFLSFCRGSKIFSTFIGFLKSKDPNDGTEQALLSELSSFNDYIKENV